MDLTPPLTRSPASTPNSHCPSDGASSFDYPSPDLVAQQYRISLFDTDLGCSTTPLMSSEPSLPPLDAMSQAEWNQAAVLQLSSSSAAMADILSADYHAFGGYGSPLPTSYGREVYGAHSSHDPSIAGTPPPGASHPRSPVPPSSRTSLSCTSGPSLSNSVAPRVKLEEEGPGGAHGLPSRPAQVPYPMEAAGYHTANGEYLSEGASPSWAQAMDSDQYYSSQGNQAGWPNDRHLRVARPPRRAQRRLTTKEEANFQCEVKGCGKLFSRSYNYKAHMETHDENREYPFPCQVNNCGKKFVRKTDLQRHYQSVHAKERNYGCDYCGRLFARKDTLRRHMDDGCSKRFDIGTLDLRPEGYDSFSLDGRPPPPPPPMGGHLMPPQGGLPPLQAPGAQGNAWTR